MNTPENMNFKQINWLAQMRANLENLHNQWYGWSGNNKVYGGMDKNLFTFTDSQIRKACSFEKLNITIQNANQLAEENDFWDGEMYGPLVVLGYALDDIIKHFKNCCPLHPKNDGKTCHICVNALKWSSDLKNGTSTGNYAKKRILKPWNEGRL